MTLDNTCKHLTTEEIISIIPEMNYYYYYTAFESDNTASINRETEIIYDEGYYLSTTYSEEKEYYQYDGKYYTLVENLTETEFLAGTYYEFANFTLPSSATIDPNTTYYSYEGSMLYKVVENPTAENILDYTVITTQLIRESELLKTLDTKLYEALSKKEYAGFDTVSTPTETAFYILAYYTGYSRMDVYDTDGNLLFENISWFSTVFDELYAITKDDITYIYNQNVEVLYTGTTNLRLKEYGFSNNLSSLTALENNELYQLKRIEVNSNQASNPNTADTITTTLILVVISFLALTGLVVFQIKTKNKHN